MVTLISSCMAIMPQVYIGGDVNVFFNGDGVMLLLVAIIVLIARTKR